MVIYDHESFKNSFVAIGSDTAIANESIVYSSPRGRGFNLLQNFQNGEFEKTSTLREGLLEMRGVTFFRGGIAISTKS